MSHNWSKNSYWARWLVGLSTEGWLHRYLGLHSAAKSFQDEGGGTRSLVREAMSFRSRFSWKLKKTRKRPQKLTVHRWLDEDKSEAASVEAEDEFLQYYRQYRSKHALPDNWLDQQERLHRNNEVIFFCEYTYWGKNPYFIQKITYWKSQFLENSPFWIFIFHKIHVFY